MNFTSDGYCILLDALLEGRTCVTIPERHTSHEPCFVMRHDIDFGLEFVGELPVLEQDRGIRATYFIQVASTFYNPFDAIQSRLIEMEILGRGHRLGVHVDCEDLSGDDFRLAVAERIERDSLLLQARFGLVEAVSFHQPWPQLVGETIDTLIPNMYDQKVMAGYEYFSDSCQRWSKGDPLLLLRSQPVKSFQVLTHPALWQGLPFRELSLFCIEHKARYLRNYVYQHARADFREQVCLHCRGTGRA